MGTIFRSNQMEQNYQPLKKGQKIGKNDTNIFAPFDWTYNFFPWF